MLNVSVLKNLHHDFKVFILGVFRNKVLTFDHYFQFISIQSDSVPLFTFIKYIYIYIYVCIYI